MCAHWQLVPQVTSLREHLAASSAPPTMEITGLRSTTAWNFRFVISLAANADGDIFAGTFEGGGVYRSTDDGENWTLVDNGLTNTYVTALAINGAGHIFAATFGGGVFRSTDNGDIWMELNTGVPNATFLSLAVTASGYIFAGRDPLGGPCQVYFALLTMAGRDSRSIMA